MKMKPRWLSPAQGLGWDTGKGPGQWRGSSFACRGTLLLGSRARMDTSLVKRPSQQLILGFLELLQTVSTHLYITRRLLFNGGQNKDCPWSLDLTPLHFVFRSIPTWRDRIEPCFADLGPGNLGMTWMVPLSYGKPCCTICVHCTNR